MRKSMLCLFLIIFAVFINSGCSLFQSFKNKNQPDETFELPSYVPGYYAIDPIAVGNVENPLNDQKPDPDLLNLYNVGSKSTQFSISGSGEIKYLSSGVEAASGKHHVTVDHLVYSPMELILSFKKKDGSIETFPVGLVLGVCIRIKGRAISGEGSFSLTDIPGLGASTAVSAAGTNVEIEVIGIKNNTILKLPRFIGDLNANTLQTLIQNIATINAEIDADNTEIVPQIIGVDIKSFPKGVELHDVVSALRKWKAERVQKGKSIGIKVLSGDVQSFTYEWTRSAEFVEDQRQMRVERLIKAIGELPDNDAISLVSSPPVQDPLVNQIVVNRDPSNKRTTDAKVAKSILKMMVTLGKRDNTSLDAWEAAINTIE